MIISHKHKYIFVHCRKTAGSSISIMLNQYLGFWDIQVGSWNDTLANGGKINARLLFDAMGRGGLNYVPTAASRIIGRWKEGCPLSVLSQVSKMQNKKYRKLLNDHTDHASAYNVKRCFPREWETYFTFCFVRNPWDRAVSEYKWCTRKPHQKSVGFREFLERVHDPQRSDPEYVVPKPPSNWDLYTIDDQIAVDFVGRFEYLARDLQIVCGEIGLPFNDKMFPHAKKTRGSEDRYRDWYDDYTRRLVEEMYEKEIEAFGYKF